MIEPPPLNYCFYWLLKTCNRLKILSRSAVSIDLCDYKGCMCHFEDHLKDNGSKYVKEREAYVLVKKESMSSSILPLLPSLLFSK